MPSLTELINTKKYQHEGGRGEAKENGKRKWHWIGFLKNSTVVMCAVRFSFIIASELLSETCCSESGLSY